MAVLGVSQFVPVYGFSAKFRETHSQLVIVITHNSGRKSRDVLRLCTTICHTSSSGKRKAR